MLNQWKTGNTRVKGIYCDKPITGTITGDISGFQCTLYVDLDTPIDVYGITRTYVLMQPCELEVSQ